jgi:hypothetical protein
MPPSETRKHTPTFEVLPDVISPSSDQYLHLSPEERRRRDELYRQRLRDPERVAFLAGLLKIHWNVTVGQAKGTSTSHTLVAYACQMLLTKKRGALSDTPQHWARQSMALDRQIDSFVHDMYGLSDDEVGIIRRS